MNKLVQSHLEKLAEAIGEMNRLMAAAHAKIDQQAEEKERSTTETWGKDRKMAILEENVTRLNEVLEENRRLREKHTQAADHAGKLLAHVRELQGKFTP
jgi:predicted nuclease with TOPRIM domain